jgi:hypothetical protein
MSQRTSNRSFALVRDEATGLEFWEVWDERMPFGSCGYKIMAVFHDFWFTAGDDGDWNGPFCSREQIYGRQRSQPSSPADICNVRRRVPLYAVGEVGSRAHT